MLGLVKDDDLLIGRDEIADYLCISKRSLTRRLKQPNPPPVYRPFKNLQAYKSELKAWTRQFCAHGQKLTNP